MWVGSYIETLAGAEQSPQSDTFFECYGWSPHDSVFSNAEVDTIESNEQLFARTSPSGALQEPALTDRAEVEVLGEVLADDGNFPWAIRSDNLTWIPTAR